MFRPDDSLRVLVVDDTAIYRKIITDVLGEIPGVEVVKVKNLNAERVQARTKERLTNGDQDQEQDQGFLEKSPYFRKWDFVLDTSKTGPHYLIQP